MSNGLDDYAGNPDMRVALREPFPPALVSKLPATQKRPALDYVGHAAVTDRLNAAAPGWTMSEPQVITMQGSDGNPHVLAVVASMTIGSVTRWEVGDNDRQSTYGDELKRALSDWVRRAAMRFGVALDLWAKEDLLTASPTAPGHSAPPVTASRPGDGAAAVGPTGGGAADSASGHGGAPAEEGTAPVPQEPVAFGEGAPAPSGAEAVPLPVDDPDRVATDVQWERLMHSVEGNKIRAKNKINRANKTSYTYETARAGATWAELVKAMTE